MFDDEPRYLAPVQKGHNLHTFPETVKTCPHVRYTDEQLQNPSNHSQNAEANITNLRIACI